MDYIKALKSEVEGEVLNDPASLAMYATDASVYQILPKAIVIPKSEGDVIATHKIAFENKISILPRGAGTSLAGQTVGDSIVLDFSKYMNKILDVDIDKKSACVQPGVILSELNALLSHFGLLYGPDPATASRANMGGVIANNSSGSRSIVFGKAIDHIEELKIVLSDGQLLTLKDLGKEDLEEKITKDNSEGEIYRTLKEITEKDKDEIIERFPKVSRRVSGYSLDEFIDDKPWNLSKLICGSEGTLATIIELKVGLVDLPKTRGVCAVHYHDRMDAIAEVKNLLPFGPSAVELLDNNVIQIAKANSSTKNISYFIEGEPGAILIIEFQAKDQKELNDKVERLYTYLNSEKLSYAYPFFPEGSTYNHIWEVRKKGLGLLLSMRTEEKPIPFIEDACVPVENLDAYIAEVVDYCDSLDVKVILYAHASVGVLHVRPILNLRDSVDIEKFEKIAHHTLDLVIKYKGSWSGEHGDGISRSFGIPRFYGEKIYEDFVKIKKAFDPENLMNPGKIVDAPYLTEHLRYGPDYHDQKIKTSYHYRKENGFDTLIHMCNGVGLCQRVNGGVMCPSYKASLDEKDSTRGRANVLRMTLSGELFEGDFSHPDLLNVLDLCVSCKSCKTECPSNVDIAKLKSEILQKHYDKKGYGLKGLFLILSDDLSKLFSGFLAKPVNWILKRKLFKYLLHAFVGIDKRRELDHYAPIPLKKWFKNSFKASANGEEVVLFADTYISYHHTHIGKSIITLLDKLGFKVKLIDTGGSKRPLISNGFLKKAAKRSKRIYKALLPYMQEGIPIIVAEPSDHSALSEDLPDLMANEFEGKMLSKHVISLETFIADLIKDKKINGKLRSYENELVVHGHCHQKSLGGMDPMKTILDELDCKYQILDTSCCGMAGAFGFEKEHYDFSKKIFDHDLGPKISELAEDQIILASGFSCRHQIEDLGHKKAKHWAEIIHYEKE